MKTITNDVITPPDVPDRTSTASIQSANDGSETRPNPLATNDSISDSSQSNDSVVSLSEGQQRKVRLCLNALESTLGISFKMDTILSKTYTVAYGPQEKILTQGAAGNGIFIVDEGVLEVFSPKGDTVLNRLLLGDFCGELSTLFAVPCSCSVHSEHRQVTPTLRQLSSVELCLHFHALRHETAV